MSELHTASPTRFDLGMESLLFDAAWPSICDLIHCYALPCVESPLVADLAPSRAKAALEAAQLFLANGHFALAGRLDEIQPGVPVAAGHLALVSLCAKTRAVLARQGLGDEQTHAVVARVLCDPLLPRLSANNPGIVLRDWCGDLRRMNEAVATGAIFREAILGPAGSKLFALALSSLPPTLPESPRSSRAAEAVFQMGRQRDLPPAQQPPLAVFIQHAASAMCWPRHGLDLIFLAERDARIALGLLQAAALLPQLASSKSIGRARAPSSDALRPVIASLEARLLLAASRGAPTASRRKRL